MLRARHYLTSLLLIGSPAWATGPSTPPPSARPEPLPLRWAPSLTLPDASSFSLPSGKTNTAHTGQGAASWAELLGLANTQAASNRFAAAGIQIAQAQSQQAWASAWMPRIDAAASSSQQRQNYNGVGSSIPASSTSLSATLPLWRAAERALVRAQNAAVDQSQWQARLNQQNVARELSLAFLSAIESFELERLAHAQIGLLKEQLRINERLLDAGTGTVLDVLETRTRVGQARALAHDFQTRSATQALLIGRLTGGAVVLPAGLSPAQPEVPTVVPSQDEALRQMLASNPAVQDAQTQVLAAQATQQARQAERWQPTVDAVAQASSSRQVQRFEGVSEQQNVSTQSVGVQMNWPVFTGGYDAGRAREAAALLAQAEARRDEALAQIDADLRSAYQALAQARSLLAVQQELEQTAQATYAATRKAYRAGIRTNQDVLNVQQQTFLAQQNVVSARLSAVSAQASILALLDKLDAASVAPFSLLFDTAPPEDRRP